jgi:hypothetical protein
VPTLITLADAKAQLNITDTDATRDTELQTYVDAATNIVEYHCGPVSATAVVETHWTGDVTTVVLRRSPVTTVTSVVPAMTTDTSTYNPSVFLLDSTGGLLRTTDGTLWSYPITVTYTAGRSSVPAAMNLAARIIVAHLWSTQYGASDYQTPIDDTTTLPALGYAIPNRALELLAPYRLGKVVA